MRASLSATIAFSLLVISLSCKPSPHGGVVPIWTDTTGAHKVRGGDGSSWLKAVRLENGTLQFAKNYEIQWLAEHNIGEMDTTTYKAERLLRDGKPYDLIRERINGKERTFYFDLSQLTGTQRIPNPDSHDEATQSP